MPTYEYACTSCHRHVEAVQRFTDAPLETCEECGGALKRVFHPVGIVLKGSGFYSTDNRSRKRPFTPKESATDSGTESSGETKSERPAKSDKSEKSGKSETKKDSTSTTSTGSAAPKA